VAPSEVPPANPRPDRREAGERTASAKTAARLALISSFVELRAMLTLAGQILKRARSPDPETTAAMEAWFGGASRRYTAKVSQAPPAPAPRAPDPLVANLQLPDKFYIVAAFCDYPPERGVNPICEDTALLLYALHEQATKGPCRTLRPWAIFETQEQLNWDAWKALEQMPALEAMTLYCRTVEEDNPDWWNLLTAELTLAEKRDVLATAASCAEEYHAFVAAGKLVPPSKPSALPYLATAPAPPDGAFGLGQLGARLDELSVSRPIKPKTRGTIYAPSTLPKDPNNVTSAAGMKVKLKNAQNAKAEAATDALASGAEPSALDRSAKALTTWTTAEVTGTKPAPRYQHCAWVVDGREMWISHGSLNGRRLQGTPRVLDLRAMSWSSREADPCGGAPARAGRGGGGRSRRCRAPRLWWRRIRRRTCSAARSEPPSRMCLTALPPMSQNPIPRRR
jgi:acyl-CoA-binding protein